MALLVVVVDVRNYFYRVIDDDFTINVNFNDKKVEYVLKERFIRVNWIISFFLRLELRR